MIIVKNKEINNELPKDVEKEYVTKIINYATELNLLTILKNNHLIDEEDFFKIKNKIMLAYGIKSELIIWLDISPMI